MRGRWVERAGQRRRRYYRITDDGPHGAGGAARGLGPFIAALVAGGRRQAGVRRDHVATDRAAAPDWRRVVARRARRGRRRPAARHGRRAGAASRRSLRRRPRRRRCTTPRRAQRALARARRIRAVRAAAPRVARPATPYARAADDAARVAQGRSLSVVSAIRIGAPSVPPASHVRARHRARARARHRRRHHRLHRRRCRRAAAAALRGAGSARHAVGHERREGAGARSDLAGQLHGLPRAAGVQGRGGVVAARRQPRRSGPRSGARQHHRSERQPLRGARRRARRSAPASRRAGRSSCRTSSSR